MGCAGCAQRFRSGRFRGITFPDQHTICTLAAGGRLRRLCSGLFIFLPGGQFPQCSYSRAYERCCSEEISPYNPPLSAHHDHYSLRYQWSAGPVVRARRSFSDCKEPGYWLLAGCAGNLDAIYSFVLGLAKGLLCYSENVMGGHGQSFLHGSHYYWRSLNKSLGWTSSAAPFVLMATASITGSLILYCRLAFKRDKNPESIRYLFSDVLRQNWSYGRWVAGVAILFWLANSLYPSLLGIYTGLEAAATLRAAENLLAPLAHTVAALTTVLLPWVSSRLVTGGADYLRTFVIKASLVAGALAAVYVALLLPSGAIVANLLYGDQRYTGLTVILPVLCATFIIRSVSSLGLVTATKAANFPQFIFVSTVLGAAISVTLGILLVKNYGVLGAVWGQLASVTAQIMLVAFVFPRHVMKRV